jgi:hypothetical protein
MDVDVYCIVLYVSRCKTSMRERRRYSCHTRVLISCSHRVLSMPCPCLCLHLWVDYFLDVYSIIPP